MTYKPRVSLDTPERRAAYLAALAETGMYIAAADAVGCDRHTAWELRKADPTFAEECEVAMERYRLTLVKEAHRRAVEGVDRAVIGGKDRDQIVHIEKHYSDRLLELMLKRHIPEFREKSTVEHAGAVGVAQLPDLTKLSREERELVRKLVGATALSDDEN